MNDEDILRNETFEPYLKGRGPAFRLELWATPRTDWRGQSFLGYRLSQLNIDKTEETMFEGEDFAGSPLHADDSDETLRSLLVFLTLRPGDTDAEYFETYSERQREFAQTHAEALSIFTVEPEDVS